MKQMKLFLKVQITSLAFMLAMLFSISITVQAAGPSGLTQTTGYETSARVKWTPMTGVSYYGYELASDAQFTKVIYKDYAGVGCEKDFSNLSPGCTYYLRVGYGDSYDTCYQNWCEPIELVTAPSKIKAVKFIDANDTKMTLTWDAVLGATYYTVVYHNETYTTYTNSVQIPYITNNTTARVYVHKVSAEGYDAKNIDAAYVSNLTALTTKISKDNFGFLLADTRLNKYQITANNYYGSGIEVKIDDAKTGKKKFSGSFNNTSYGNVEFTNCKYNTMYKYCVRAYITTTDGQKVYGNWSAYKYFVNAKNCKYTASGNKIKLKWSKLKNVSKIKVQISKKKNSGYKTCATLKGSKTSYTISKYGKSALKKGKTYYIKITYYAKDGKKSYASDIFSTSSVKIK